MGVGGSEAYGHERAGLRTLCALIIWVRITRIGLHTFLRPSEMGSRMQKNYKELA